VVILGVAGSALAQKFEVATVKVNRNPPPAISAGGGPPLPPPPPELRPTPNGLTVSNAPVQYLMQWAYEIRPWQIVGPDWIRSDKFDITAKASDTVTVAQLRLLLQALLSERFRMEIRREMRDAPVMALIEAKSGSKLKPSTTEGNPSIAFKILGAGSMHWDCQRTPLKMLEGFVTNYEWDPVVDTTGLTGKFDFSYTRPARDPESPGSWLGEIQASLQEQLGLKLERRKAPIEFLVIDKAEKTPIEN
jgi:uncharacterized protein (TIGR03435 family)